MDESPALTETCACRYKFHMYWYTMAVELYEFNHKKNNGTKAKINLYMTKNGNFVKHRLLFTCFVL